MLPRQRLILICLVPLTVVSILLFGLLLAESELISPDDMRVSDSLFVSAANAEWLALAAFAPLVIALAFAWQREHPVTEYFQPEWVGVFAWWITLANGYAALSVSRLAGLLPALDPGPESLTEARLANLPVNYVVIGLTVVTVGFFVWFLFSRHDGFGAMADRIFLPHRRVALLVLLTTLAVGIWLFGGLYFALTMALPAWLWIFVEPTTQTRIKILNVLLTLGGGLGLILPLLLLPAGVTAWTIIAAGAYFVIWPMDVLLYFLALALFIRFLRLGLSTPYLVPTLPEDPLLALLKNR